MKAFETFLFYTVRLSAILLPLIAVGGILARHEYAGLAVVFGYYFGVELLLWASGLEVNSTPGTEFDHVNPTQPGVLDRWGVEIYAVLHLAALPLGIYLLSQGERSGGGLAGGVLSLGVMAGSVGGLAGHEFIHRRARIRRWLGIAVYGSVNYAHFTVSHLYGHHRLVGTPEDWSTSRRNESSYHFLGRAFFHGYLGAWRLETRRLRKRGLAGGKLWRAHFIVRVTAAALVLNALVLVLLGAKGLLLYAATSILAFTLMEMVNYLSHYGLGRARNAKGAWEKVGDQHSWESNNKVTNWFIFNAGKHCHHHRDPFASHDQLELAHTRDYIPFGLPLMTLIAFVPPLYFSLMNRRLDDILAQNSSGGANDTQAREFPRDCRGLDVGGRNLA